jgi:hypothetical protein
MNLRLTNGSTLRRWNCSEAANTKAQEYCAAPALAAAAGCNLAQAPAAAGECNSAWAPFHPQDGCL